MSIETVFVMRRDRPGTDLQELDAVRVLNDVTTDEGHPIAAGTIGTVVAIWTPGETYEVEFPEPMGSLAIVSASQVQPVHRPAR